MSLYEMNPVLENGRFCLRKVSSADVGDLHAVYSDLQALPFFNSDNCDGDNFYYESRKRMKEAVDFWQTAWNNAWFARLAIEDLQSGCVIGTTELCLRVSDDEFNQSVILRIDLRSDYEKKSVLSSLVNLIMDQIPEYFGTRKVISKAWPYAIERQKAFAGCGFRASSYNLIGKDGYPYRNYWEAESAEPAKKEQ